MKKPVKIFQSQFGVDLPESYDNYLVLTFFEDNKKSTHFIKFPDWYRFHDRKSRYYIFSQN